MCSKFNVLPNDPRIKQLEPIQWVWLLSNMERDIKELNKSLTGHGEGMSIDSEEGVDVNALSALSAAAHNGRTNK